VFGVTTIALTEPIEAVNISEHGAALVSMVDFSASETIEIEQQAEAGDVGIFGWEGRMIAYYRSRGWNADIETVFRQNGHRYTTLNLPRQET
jgi:hypothetical protein